MLARRGRVGWAGDIEVGCARARCRRSDGCRVRSQHCKLSGKAVDLQGGKGEISISILKCDYTRLGNCVQPLLAPSPFPDAIPPLSAAEGDALAPVYFHFLCGSPLLSSATAVGKGNVLSARSVESGQLAWLEGAAVDSWEIFEMHDVRKFQAPGARWAQPPEHSVQRLGKRCWEQSMLHLGSDL